MLKPLAFSVGKNLERYLLTDIIKKDLNHLQPKLDPLFFNKVGHILLVFSGYEFQGNKGWVQTKNQLNLENRVKAITPSWKGGDLNYERIIVDQTAPPLSDVDSMLDWLNSIGFYDITLPNKEKSILQAYHTMFSWNLSPPDHDIPLDPDAIFAFSFGADHGCVDANWCQHPGETNELIAHDIIQYIRGRSNRGKSEPLKVYAQWEIASGLKDHIKSPHSLFVAGRPGTFHSTAQIWQFFLDQQIQQLNSVKDAHGIVMGHPDHILRAIQTGVAVNQRYFHQQKTILQPAIYPLNLDWPMLNKQSKTGTIFDMYGKNSVQLSTGRTTSWYDELLGYSPSNPQPFVRNREIWLLYELWARAKLVMDSNESLKKNIRGQAD